MTPLTDFIKTTLYPALFGRIDRAFPEMRFQQVKGEWHSRLKLDLTPDERPDKSVITRKVPTRVLEQGGGSKDLIEFYQDLNNIPRDQTFEAVESMCRAIGIQPPERQNAKEWQEFMQKVERREMSLRQMEAALYNTDQGAAVLNYLHTSRGYSDEVIRKMGLVCITKEIADQMEEAPRGIENTHPLAIPYYSGGRLLGFKFRAISSEVQPKYKNTFGLPKKASLFGLTGLKLTGNKEKDRTLTIVEGELDALHAQVMGVENIVAAAGGELSDEALREAMQMNVERVVILFDTEDTDKGQQNTDKKIKKAIDLIHKQGLKVYVASLPSPDGQKMDVDSYLSRNQVEALEAIIEQPQSASQWLYSNLEQKALQKYNDQTDKSQWSQLNIDDFKDDVIRLANHPITDPSDRHTIFSLAAEFSKGVVTKESLQERADQLKAEQDAQRQIDQTKSILSKSLALANSDKADEALALMEKELPELRQISKEAQFGQYLNIPPFGQFSNYGQGIKTPYYFTDRNNKEKEQLILPSAALSIIAAPTSHGKSTMMRNLALQAAQSKDDGVVLFFTLEENMDNLKIQFVSQYLPFAVSGNNYRTISDYLKQHSLQYFSPEYRNDVFKMQEVDRYIQKFEDEVWNTGKLRPIFISKRESGYLIELISFLCKSIKVKAVFIDYIQKLHKAGSRNTRREELGEISGDFEALANKFSIPIIMGAQVNREAYSPLELANQNIGDSANIEWGASVIVMLWNSKFKALPKSSQWESKPDGKQSPEQTRLTEKGLILGDGGKMFALLTKNRAGNVGLSSVWEYDQARGIITDKENATEQKAAPTPTPSALTNQSSYGTPFGSLDEKELPF